MARYRFALLGDPVEHSRSPEIHDAMFALSGLEGDYLAIRADAGVLERTVDELRSGGWDGLNVTMPLKVVAAQAADALAPLARKSGSVNTLVRSNGSVVGHSTDSSTFHSLITSERFAGLSSILVLGAGGTAAAALAAIHGLAPVYVTARKPAPAEHLASRLGGEIVTWGTAVAGSLVVNTTPLGMAGEPLPERILEAASGLIDLPYGPEPTPAVLTAARRKLPHADGHEFLLRQAMESFTLWTGRDVGFEGLNEALRKA